MWRSQAKIKFYANLKGPPMVEITEVDSPFPSSEPPFSNSGNQPSKIFLEAWG